MQYVMITGSNRGIGLAVVREYLAQHGDVTIFACCRTPDNASELHALQEQYPKRIIIVTLEVTEQESIENAVQSIQQHTDSLDVLINNAGIDPNGQTLETITSEMMLRVYEVNTVAPLMISKAFLPLLDAGAKLIHISTSMASLEGRTYGGNYGYCSSKAALNMMMRGLAADLRSRKIITVALDPGWARTDMGGASASLAPEESAEGIVSVIDKLTFADTGRYLVHDGTESAW